MALGKEDLDTVLEKNAPVLMLDTCVLLDLVRDITREDVLDHNMQAAMGIHQAATTGNKLVLLLAAQVELELGDRLSGVEQEAKKSMDKYEAQAKRMEQVALAFGGAGVLSIAPVTGHRPRARAVLDAWDSAALRVSEGDDIPRKASRRVKHAIAPSRKGKENMKDCIVIETYLEAAQQLRGAGFTGKLVFGSSNVNDYVDPATRNLHASLAAEMAPLNMEYGVNFGSMKHLLGV